MERWHNERSGDLTTILTVPSTKANGRMTWPDNTQYVGQWKDNKRNGKGAMTYPDGTKQVGEFKDGKFIYQL